MEIEHRENMIAVLRLTRTLMQMGDPGELASEVALRLDTSPERLEDLLLAAINQVAALFVALSAKDILLQRSVTDVSALVAALRASGDEPTPEEWEHAQALCDQMIEAMEQGQ